MQITIQDLMTHQPASTHQTATIDEALQILLREEVGEIYVTDDSSQLLGVVPDYELLKAKLTDIPGNRSVGTLMSANLASVSPNMYVAEVMPLFRDGRCQQLAVVDEGRLVGQISRRDILRLVATLEQLDSKPESVQEETHSAAPVEPLRGPRFLRVARQTSPLYEND